MVLQLGTPGGPDNLMREIVRDILAAPVPAAVFVALGGARAARAGTYILDASHIAAMTRKMTACRQRMRCHTK